MQSCRIGIRSLAWKARVESWCRSFQELSRPERRHLERRHPERPGREATIYFVKSRKMPAVSTANTSQNPSW